MDYCNSLLAGVADVYLQRLQSVQNAAARLVTGANRHDHDHAGSCWPALAASTPANHLQDCDACVKVST